MLGLFCISVLILFHMLLQFEVCRLAPWFVLKDRVTGCDKTCNMLCPETTAGIPTSFEVSRAPGGGRVSSTQIIASHGKLAAEQPTGWLSCCTRTPLGSLRVFFIALTPTCTPYRTVSLHFFAQWGFYSEVIGSQCVPGSFKGPPQLQCPWLRTSTPLDRSQNLRLEVQSRRASAADRWTPCAPNLH